MAENMWGGRFSEETAALARQYGDSLRFDQQLAVYDLAGSLAHATMLEAQGILDARDLADIQEGLRTIGVEIAERRFPRPGAEDIHSAVEMRLKELVGAAAGKLHTARSRNDQVATDLHLYVLDQGTRVGEAVRGLQKAIVEVAENHVQTVMPGFTHLQPAQPVTLAHHLLAYFWMLERDAGRLTDALNRSALSPLGAAALAGTPFPIDRDATAAELGFDAPYPNSMDAVSDRDFVVEFLAAAALCMAHLSRLCEELILWSTPQYGFVELSDAYATGSSIMPQKKNPDLCELIRGKSGRAFGNLQAMLVVLKGTPLAYNKDFQEDKEALFDTVQTLLPALPLMGEMLRTAAWKPDRMRAAAGAGYSSATDLADHLAMRGLPFREAHEVVGAIVRQCVERGVGLDALASADLQAFSHYFEPGYTAPDVDGSVAARASYGGPAPVAVHRQLDEARAILESPDADAPDEPEESLQ
jgi:argininosuccinate lyase